MAGKGVARRRSDDTGVKPLRDRNTQIVALYDTFFRRQSLRMIPLSDDVLERATVMRASLGIKTPDAIHLASAFVAKADAFVTGDIALQRCKDVNVVVVGDS